MPHKHTLILLFLLFGSQQLISQGLFEQSLEGTGSGNNSYLGGKVRNVFYVGTGSDNDKLLVQSMYSQLNLLADYRAGEYGKAFADIRFRGGYEFENRFANIDIREAYGEIFAGPVNISAGKQILSWGASSFINPSDQFSPVDRTFRSPFTDDQYLGQWALQADLLIRSTSTLQLLWIPVHQPSALMVKPFDFPAYIGLKAYEPSPGLLSESGFGFRYDLRSGFMDLQLSYYNGFRNDPAISLDTAVFDAASLQPEMIGLAREPYRIHSAGFNITIPVGSYLLRTEGAWMEPFSEEGPQEKPLSELAYTLEIEQSGPNVSLIAGYYGKYILDFEGLESDLSMLTEGFPDPAAFFPPGTVPDQAALVDYIGLQVHGFNRLYNYQQKEFYHAAYASATISVLHDQVEVEIPGMYNFTTGELTFMPAVKYDVTDGLSLQMGAFFLAGDEQSLFDLIAPVLNAGYLLVEFNF